MFEEGGGEVHHIERERLRVNYRFVCSFHDCYRERVTPRLQGAALSLNLERPIFLDAPFNGFPAYGEHYVVFICPEIHNLSLCPEDIRPESDVVDLRQRYDGVRGGFVDFDEVGHIPLSVFVFKGEHYLPACNGRDVERSIGDTSFVFNGHRQAACDGGRLGADGAVRDAHRIVFELQGVFPGLYLYQLARSIVYFVNG